MINTTVADLQVMLRDLPPEMPVRYEPTEPVKRWPQDLATRLSLAHAHLFRAKEVIGTILAEYERKPTRHPQVGTDLASPMD
jgi:hypothetical protein